MSDWQKATCHCGAVELSVRLSDGLNTLRRCDCSFCRRRQAAAVSAPLDGAKVVKGADNLSMYQWGTKTAKHYFCKTCGIYTHHQRRSNPNEFGFERQISTVSTFVRLNRLGGTMVSITRQINSGLVANNFCELIENLLIRANDFAVLQDIATRGHCFDHCAGFFGNKQTSRHVPSI